MIEIRDLVKKFGTKTAVNDLNLHIQKGEFFTFLGPNGAGKTTTLKIIAGLLRPTSGQVFINNCDIATNKSVVKKLISYVPDVPYVYEKLTGREFLYFIGELYKLDKGYYLQEVEYLLDIFQMKESGDLLMENYSHGMRQKIVLGSTLLHKPELIIIDEPMVGLDPRNIRLVKDLLLERTKNGTTIFMTTHTLTLAEELSDRIGIINKGKLITIGTVEEIKKRAESSEGLEEIFLRLTSEFFI
ncbi:MAG: ABC transporter ATP-binding protein [bacterium]